MRPFEDNFQMRVLRAYTALRLLRPEWGGGLIVACGLGPEGAALAMAANIAGAACLSIEPQPDVLKGALRSGACDFIVNNVDEALRAMKNEIRKCQPLSVGLMGDRLHVLQELVERGVQPELLADCSGDLNVLTADEGGGSYREALQRLRIQGALLVDFTPGLTHENAVDAWAVLESYVADREWAMRSFRAESAAALMAFDARALSLLVEEDVLRSRWLRSVSRILQRQRPFHRVLWLTPEEEPMLLAEPSQIA